ncbi:Na+/H+ antiporter NhaC family protein [Evansella clarkii]|uniref:Na+/H+ antiporter NhaC family protein n=1 Tax=Evansella clarkii TaxID=79879 RepID=UPI00143036A4|nr:Na+/H+ antiporter NhaC family protein [Evansella clarkii]
MEVAETYGIISLIPVAVVIIAAIITKKATESLILGTFVAAIIIAGGDFWNTWFDYTLTEIGDSAYYIIMFGMFGAMIRILKNSGSALGFTDIGARVAKSRNKSLLLTWLFGILIFVDDYLNSLSVGVAMQNITDKFKVSREFLAFIVNSTGAAICILVPFSTWAILYAAQIEEVGVVAGVSGFMAYVNSIPYMLYAWIAVLIVPFFIFGIIPFFGPMKTAETRAAAGRVLPEDFKAGEEEDEIAATTEKSSAWNFIVPLLALIGITIYSSDIVLGVIIAIVVAFVMLFVQRLMTFGQLADNIIGGFKDMLYVTMLVLSAFVLQKFNDDLGLTPYVIDQVTPILSPALFPVVTFIVISILAFATGSFWGVAAISFPIILPIALAMGVDPYLAIGTVAAATAFGSHACFYGDAVTVTCAAVGIKNIDYARTSLLLIIVPFVLGIAGYLVLGFIMA